MNMQELLELLPEEFKKVETVYEETSYYGCSADCCNRYLCP